ncbi:MAG: radical SAM protein [Candidatus Aminicenantes bacterium]|nr:MAG: radical SAM protein [Candidatus Aminicenantes bacterium]
MTKKKSLNPLKRKEVIRFFMRRAAHNSLLRRVVINKIQKSMWRNLVEKNRGQFPRQVQLDKIDMGKALFGTIHRNIKRKLFSKQWLNKFMDIHIENLETRGMTVKKAIERVGFEPPLFITISPEEKCNLNCPGCYAESNWKTAHQLDWDTFDRILTEKRELWGSYFTVISGGEPFLWQDKGKTFIDMIKKHDNQFFLVYTNGTLIDKDMTRQLLELGNLTPGISVEGFEKETDARRGKGVYKKILNAMENLRSAGVPFGVSITAMRHNWDLVSRDEFFDFWFNQQGATYAWIFQYMPIGRNGSFEMMVTPEQRMEMLIRMWKAVREKKLFMADFWNSGTTTSGCIAGGRPGGYFYITWKGDITPCVFVPYSANNIYDLYKKGGTLDDILLTPMFKRVREWQASYGFSLYDPRYQGCCAQNWLAPCFIRDHHEEFMKAARDSSAKPIDVGADNAWASDEYHQQMIKYGEEFNAISSSLWNSFYIADQGKN